MQVLKTLLKSSEVEISQSSFKELFSAVKKYCYWLDPDRGTLRYEEWQEVMRCLCCDFPCGEKICLSLWSVGNLISTALGLLQSEGSDSWDSTEQLQGQMEEMNLYDNIGDEEEKQSIKTKNKSQKNDRSQEQILLAHPTAPLVEPPPCNPETPWDDGFAFKLRITVPNKMRPLQKEVRMAQLQGDEDALVLPVAVTQIPPDPQFPQGGMHYDYNAIPFKTIKEIK